MEKESKMQSYLESHLMSIPELEVGQIVTGTVVQTNDETVLVDIGYKSEGQVPVDEFIELPKVGDKVALTILKLDNGRGQVVVSKKRAEAKEKTEALRKASEDRTPVLGKFVKTIKGGYEVDLGADYKGFCPLSKADVVRVENPEELIGKTDFFIIDKFHNGTKLKSVVSRREYLEQKIAENRQQFFETAHVGDVVQGVVKSFTSFGAFIDLGGFDGLLHINDMSWGHVTRPKDFVKKGQIIQLKLINIDPETQKINLSLKAMEPDPWSTFDQKYQIGDVIRKPVTKIANFGIFIEIEPGIEGLAHVSELSWTKKITNPKDFCQIGDVVEAKILGWDLDHKRVSLGLKQLEENPWDTILERFPVGKTLSAPVVKVTNTGAFINLEDGIDGFLHMDDVSWTKKLKSMDQFCKEGDVIEVQVSKVEPENKRIKLSVKQLSGNPWQTLQKEYPKFSTITGTVSSVADFGVFVKVLGDIEGLISKFNLVGPDEEYKDSVLESYTEKIGQPITAMVIDINPKAEKLGLSIKEMKKRSMESEMAKYMADTKEDDDTYNPFAEILKKN
jgi:small subunit ribosomal protein S1